MAGLDFGSIFSTCGLSNRALGASGYTLAAAQVTHTLWDLPERICARGLI